MVFWDIARGKNTDPAPVNNDWSLTGLSIFHPGKFLSFNELVQIAFVLYPKTSEKCPIHKKQ